jgi:2-amino-4-hydroxy-6-hydroxymethyldihydropteridine diphosphokinase
VKRPAEIDEAAVVALGANMVGGWPSLRALLEAALARFPDEGLTVLARSSWWRSKSWPDPSAPDYLNGVALVQTGLAPIETLHALRRIEAAFGRERRAANAPRTLDLDLIAHGRAVLSEPELTLPHPRAAERRFVMGPLAEIAPDWRHPVDGRNARTLATAAEVGRDAAPI